MYTYGYGLKYLNIIQVLLSKQNIYISLILFFTANMCFTTLQTFFKYVRLRNLKFCNKDCHIKISKTLKEVFSS